MELFEWNNNLETGIGLVDRQHRKLIDITNSLGGLLSTDNIQREDLEKVFQELIDYTKYHFDEEEKVMESYNLDKRHISSHKEVHKTFIQDVLELKKEFVEENKETSKNLFDFLTNWLVYHILGADMKMTRQINAIENGINPIKAYEMESNTKDRSASMLLNSLDSLFEQISQKNKKLKELNQNLENKVEERTKELYEANIKLHQLATTDALTGIANRRKAMELLEVLWNEAQEKNMDLSCIMIDADNFKEINDTYGHDAGDIVLKELSKELKYSIRTDDIVCRLGGDEFFVICPSTDKQGVLNIANIVHEKVNKLNVQVKEGVWKGSISVGVATKTSHMKESSELIKQADLAVYASKDAGKNCVRTADD